MNLTIASACGTAATELAAFDDALLRIGAANYNLVRLSSVIPPASTITEHDGPVPWPGGEWGDRLYVVYAEQRASTPGEAAWAGVGWVRDDITGRGLFVEHEGHSEAAIRDAITASLTQLQAGRGVRLGPIHMKVTGTVCTDRPVCALVLCAYTTEPWNTPPTRAHKAPLELASACS